LSINNYHDTIINDTRNNVVVG